MSIPSQIRRNGFCLLRGLIPENRLREFKEGDDPERFFGLERTSRALLGTYTVYNWTFMEDSPRIGLHTDGIIQSTTDKVLCMWVPFDPCGVDAPGLAIVPAGRRRVINYLRRHFHGKKIPGWSSSSHEWNETPAFRPETIREEFGDLVYPVMNPGDVVLFTNWTIHGSHVTTAMTKKRAAFVYRIRALTSEERRRDNKLKFLNGLRRIKARIRSYIP